VSAEEWGKVGRYLLMHVIEMGKEGGKRARGRGVIVGCACET
jgi:hypothetical protein